MASKFAKSLIPRCNQPCRFSLCVWYACYSGAIDTAVQCAAESDFRIKKQCFESFVKIFDKVGCTAVSFTLCWFSPRILSHNQKGLNPCVRVPDTNTMKNVAYVFLNHCKTFQQQFHFTRIFSNLRDTKNLIILQSWYNCMQIDTNLNIINKTVEMISKVMMELYCILCFCNVAKIIKSFIQHQNRRIYCRLWALFGASNSMRFCMCRWLLYWI
jgi:hypothetical protein